MSFIDKAKEAFEHGKDIAAEKLAEAKEAAEGLVDKAKETVSDTVDKATEAAGNAKDAAADAAGGEILRIQSDPGTLPNPGVLGLMGYRVGQRGLPPQQRRQILRNVYRVPLVPTSPWTEEYVREWGQRCTEARWTKMRQVLYGLNAVAEKNPADMSEAIADREQDLQWLTDDYRKWLDSNYGL